MAYATTTQLTYLGLPSDALTDVSADAKTAALDGASGIADGYLRKRYATPLAVYGNDLTTHVCSIAAWIILKTRGFNPENPADVAIRMGYEDAIKWLEAVAKGEIEPEDIEDATASVDEAAPVVEQDNERGWGFNPDAEDD